MITIFTTPKNFKDIFNKIQYNALSSWRAISPDIEIIIFGDSKGSKAAAAKINAKYIPEVRCSPRGVPFLSDLFYKAEKIAKFSILVYNNADIILPKNFLSVVQNAAKEFTKLLMVGYRWDMDVKNIINFQDPIENELFWERSKKESIKHGCTGSDYLVFRKNSFRNIPDLVIGRPGYDNWLIWKARRSFIPVIDISNEVMVIHQNHNYRAYTDPKLFPEPDSIMNKNIHGDRTLNLLDTNYHLINGKVEKKHFKEFKNRNLGKLPKIFPEFSIPLAIYKKLYRKYWLRFG